MTAGIAVWGFGGHARKNVVPAIESSPDWQLKAVISRSGENFGPNVVVCPDPAEVLGREDVSAVYICTPNGMHPEQAARALSLGKHVFIEKPSCFSAREALELTGLAEQKGLVCAETFMFAYHPQFQSLKTVVADSRAYGDVQSMSFRFGIPGPAPGNVRLDPGLGGGALRDLGVYGISAALRLTGGQVEPVAARLSWSPEYAVDSSGVLLLAGGTGFPIICEWGFWHAYQNVGEVWTSEYLIRADRVFAKPESLETSVVLNHSDSKRSFTRVTGMANHFVKMLAAFKRAVSDSESRQGLYEELKQQAELLEKVEKVAYATR
jgi:NDP-hexose-3-ketoreductase